GGFFPGSGRERGRDHIFFHAVEDRPMTIAGRLRGPARPKHFIGGPSQEVYIAFRVFLHNVLYPLGAIIGMPPVIHRVRVKDTIEGYPRLHPELSHVCSPFPFMYHACKSQDAVGEIGIMLRAVPCRKSVFSDRLPTQIPVLISPTASWDLQ